VSRPPRRPLVKRLAALAAGASLLAGAPFFRHCGLNTLLLNATIPGSGNTLNLTLGQLSSADLTAGQTVGGDDRSR
jgi:hypothetical protein